MKALSGKDLTRMLEARGWILRRINGSHHIYARTGSAIRISVPVHGSKPLQAGLQKHIMKLADISEGEL